MKVFILSWNNRKGKKAIDKCGNIDKDWGKVMFSLDQNQTQTPFNPLFNPLFNPKFFNVNFNSASSLNTFVDTLNNSCYTNINVLPSVKQIHDPES